jgi:hypothetical protein
MKSESFQTFSKSTEKADSFKKFNTVYFTKTCEQPGFTEECTNNSRQSYLDQATEILTCQSNGLAQVTRCGPKSGAMKSHTTS